MSGVLLCLQIIHLAVRAAYYVFNLRLKIKRSWFFVFYWSASLLYVVCIRNIPFLSTHIPGVPFEIPYKLIIDFILSFFAILLFSSDGFYRKLTVFCLEKIILVMSELVCALLFSGITGISSPDIPQADNGAMTTLVIVNILFDAIYIVLLFLTSYFLTGKGGMKKHLREFTPAILIMAIQTLLFATAVFQQEGTFSVPFTIFTFCAMIVCILSDIYLIVIAPPKTAENRALRENLRCMEEIQAGEREFFSSLLEKEREMAELRHDWNNLLQVAAAQMDTSTDSDHNQKEKNLLQALSDRVNQTRLPRYCQNEMVNVLLNAKAGLLKDKSIPFEISCTLSERTTAENLDLCSIFSHLVDNAVEYCIAYPSEENKIKISAKIPSADCIAIRGSCYIPLLPKSAFNKSTRKEKRTDYRTDIIRSIVDKYDGDYNISYENKTMNASVFFSGK